MELRLFNMKEVVGEEYNSKLQQSIVEAMTHISEF
jgi:hypothetical protein